MVWNFHAAFSIVQSCRMKDVDTVRHMVYRGKFGSMDAGLPRAVFCTEDLKMGSIR